MGSHPSIADLHIHTFTERAVTVIGVRPDALLIIDPWFGQHWHSKAQFEAA